MNPKPAHTPTPEDCIDLIRAMILALEPAGVDPDPDKVSYIFRAVNAHEELLKSAKEALSTLDKGKAFSPDSKLAIALNLYKAIAYAEGK